MNEEYIFWKLAHYFVEKENYRIVYWSEEHNELWLDNPDSKKQPIIRMKNIVLDWSRSIEQDLRLVGINSERIRKQRMKRNLQVVNLYISPYPPVDDYEFKISQLNKFKSTTVTTLILSRVTKVETLAYLRKHFFQDQTIPELINNEEITIEEINAYKKKTVQISAQKDREDKAIFNFGKPRFTYIFIFIQLLMFLLLELNGGSQDISTLIAYGAKYNPLILEGEWWRFITPIFLHIGYLHIIMNTLGLYFLGAAVERIYGSFRFLWIYLFAGVVGSIASFVFSPNISAGASGAIYGCFGALLYIGLIYPKLFFRTLGMNVIFILLLNIVLSFSFPSIDQAGHFGGLIAGFLATGMVHFPKQKSWKIQLISLIMGILLVITLSTYGYNKPVHLVSEASVLQFSQEYIKNKDYDKAYALLTNYKENGKNPSARFYFQISYVEIQKGLLDQAEFNLSKAIQLNKQYHEAHYNLALVLLQKNKMEIAKEHLETAVKLDPDNLKYQDILNQLK